MADPFETIRNEGLYDPVLLCLFGRDDPGIYPKTQDILRNMAVTAQIRIYLFR